MDTLRIGSLCTGLAGFDLGFEMAGCEIAWMCDIDRTCRSVLRRHFPRVPLHEDIHAVGAHNLAPVDVICGGTPCQSMSAAGKREGIHGEKSRLFFEFIRVVRELRPSFVIWENVPGARTGNNGDDFRVILRAFHELGARDIAWRSFDSQYFGLAQRRERVFIVVDFAGERAGEILFKSEGLLGSPPSRGAQAQEDTALSGALSANGGGPGRPAGNANELDFRVAEVAGTLGGGSGTRGWCDDLDRATFIPLVARCETSRNERIDYETETFIPTLAFDHQCGGDVRMGVVDNLSTTLQANQTVAVAYAENGMSSYREGFGTLRSENGGECGSGSETLIATLVNGAWKYFRFRVRRLTPTEAERLQGFSDGWTATDDDGKPIADSPRYRMLGNACSVSVCAWIARRLCRSVYGGLT